MDATDWSTVRRTALVNYQSNQGLSGMGSVTSPDFRCYQGTTAPSVGAIVAGDTVGFQAAASVSHFGPVQFYMAKVPEGQDVKRWAADGSVWFKVGSISAVITGKALTSSTATWPAYGTTNVNFTMPRNIPNGDYILRVESIALHQAQAVGGAQIYLSCAQVSVTGGGNGTPGPLVAIPGVYKATDPGLVWSYSSPQMTYDTPGPAVWTG
ncbi:hypothetical protein EG329_009960 [Mollisiaceae sp. DMI_Dod_QoI]|nr:hypothetical protein EG329_009960 [Helotiales sp. DMI_Dod_QoI]